MPRRAASAPSRPPAPPREYRVVAATGPADVSEDVAAALLAWAVRPVPPPPDPPRPLGRRARLRAFKARHRACAACGFEPPPASRSRALHVHHVVPLERGGTDDPSNLLVLCATCHATAHALLARRPRAKPRRFGVLARLATLAEGAR